MASNGMPIAAPSGRSRTNERPRSATIDQEDREQRKAEPHAGQPRAAGG
jgi:hypothetical protein